MSMFKTQLSDEFIKSLKESMEECIVEIDLNGFTNLPDGDIDHVDVNKVISAWNDVTALTNKGLQHAFGPTAKAEEILGDYNADGGARLMIQVLIEPPKTNPHDTPLGRIIQNMLEETLGEEAAADA